MAQWFAPLLKQHLADQPAADAVVGADAGPLLWQDQPEGWLLATRPQSPARDAVDARLQEQGVQPWRWMGASGSGKPLAPTPGLGSRI